MVNLICNFKIIVMTLRNILVKSMLMMLPVATIIGCQKMDKPALGDYPEDHLASPTTPLRFFVSFDSTGDADKQINIRFKDSISGYPSFFPDNAIHAIAGKHGGGYESTADKYLAYINANDFPSSTSFTIAFWEKHNGVPESDAETIFSIPSTNGHWSKTTMFLIMDHKGSGATTDSAVIKFVLVDGPGNADTWLVWEKNSSGDGRIKGLYDNQWHHLAFVYNETTSMLSLYKDGVFQSAREWAGHGPLKMQAGKVSNFYLGGKKDVKNDWEWGQSWIGGLDQFRLYNKVLTAAEIQALYTNQQ
jgi:hypothetical protein